MTKEGLELLKMSLRSLVKSFEGCGKEGSSCCGVTHSQWDVLVEVGEKGGMALVDLAKGLGLDTSTLSRTVNGMVMVGLLERIQSQADRRYVTINLSEQGKVLLEQIDDIYDRQLSMLLEYIPLERHSVVIEVLTEVAVASQKVSEDSSRSCCL